MNEAVFIEFLVNRRGENGFITKMPPQSPNPLRGREGVEEAEVFGAAFLEELTGGDGAAAGGEHGIANQHFIFGEARWEFFEVRLGFESGFIAGHAEIADAGFGQELVRQRNKALPSTENGHEQDYAAKHLHRRSGERGADALVFGGEIARGLGEEDEPELAQGTAKGFHAGGLITQGGEALLREGMADEGGRFHLEKRCGER